MPNTIRCILFTMLLTATAVSLHAQREADNWIINATWLNFGGGNAPTIQLAPQSTISRTASIISDANGRIQFYYDGGFAYNRNHQVLPYVYNNGGFPNLLYGANGFWSMARQGSLIVPWPGRDSLYILFHIHHDFNNNFQSELNYSIINMNLDGGLGDVQQANIPLLNGADVCLKLTASLHCNKKDVWVVGHLRNSDQYFTLAVTAAGVNTTPLFSTCNMIPDGIGVTGYDENHYGTMKISALGDKLAAAHLAQDYVEFCDFDNQTGLVSNPKKLYTKPGYIAYSSAGRGVGALAVEFSPSGQRLYVSSDYYSYWSPDFTNRFVGRQYQFNTALTTEATIQASRYLIDTSLAVNSSMQVANNGKLYMNAQASLMNRVDNPEGLGAACSFVFNGVPSPYFTQGNLPSFLQSYFRYPIIATGNCQFQNISFNIQNPIGISSIAWDFGDPASGVNNTSASFTPTHIYTTQGTYTVKAVLQNSNGCGADTIKKIIHAGPFKVFLGNDTTICQGDTLQLKMNIPGGSNFWYNNSFDTAVKITQPGKYWVRVSLGECTATDTIEVFTRSLPQFTLGADTVICSNTNVTLAPNPVFAGTYTWSNNAATPTITVSNAGNYWLQITDNIGCKWRDTIGVSFKTLPNFSLGNDTAICQKDTLVLNATVIGATGYTWSTGATTPQIKTWQSGIYWCDVSRQGCTYRDSITLTVKSLPIVNLGNDTTICENTSIILNAQNPGSSYLWSTGSQAQSIAAGTAGQYAVTITKAGCISSDTINIAIELRPRFTLGADRLICPGETITLQPALNPLWQLLWQDGSRAATYPVTQPGLYYLDATTRCGTIREDIVFTKGLCKVNIPNAFTPNGDGLNDVLKALGTEVVTNFNLKIFNRYGQLVFESKDKNIGWDGRFNGQRANNGAYTCICTYRELNGTKEQMIKGVVLVIR
jgi:gliding motility-associated-like protein